MSQQPPRPQPYGSPQPSEPSVPATVIPKRSSALGIIGFVLAVIAAAGGITLSVLASRYFDHLYYLGYSVESIGRESEFQVYTLGIFAFTLPGLAALIISIIAAVRGSVRQLAIVGIAFSALAPVAIAYIY